MTRFEVGKVYDIQVVYKCSTDNDIYDIEVVIRGRKCLGIHEFSNRTDYRLSGGLWVSVSKRTGEIDEIQQFGRDVTLTFFGCKNMQIAVSEATQEYEHDNECEDTASDYY